MAIDNDISGFLRDEQQITRGVQFVRRSSENESPNSEQMEILQNTIGIIPAQHLQHIARIEARAPNELPRKGGGNENGVIRLSESSFSKQRNEVLNITFLHELGHVVDIAYGCTTQIQRFAGDRNHILREDAHALLDTPVDSGRDTKGLPERIADCYQIMFKWFKRERYTQREMQIDGVKVVSRHYQGREAQRRFRVLLATTAFSQFNMEMLTRSIRNPTQYLMSRNSNLSDESFNQLIRSLLR